MLEHYLIFYDMADSRRLGRLSKLLACHGMRIQKSVFELYLSEGVFNRLRRAMEKIVDAHVDRVGICHLCSTCSKNMEFLGQKTALQKPESYIIL